MIDLGTSFTTTVGYSFLSLQMADVQKIKMVLICELIGILYIGS